MNIPKSIKIGGKNYAVEISENFYLGAANVKAEILFDEQIIRLKQSHTETMQCAFLHEMIHGILEFVGETEHDEKFVEAIAQALFAVITDNPEVFAKQEDIV